MIIISRTAQDENIGAAKRRSRLLAFAIIWPIKTRGIISSRRRNYDTVIVIGDSTKRHLYRTAIVVF